jgi:hypothetical protein
VAEQSRSEVAVDAPDAARPEHALGVSINNFKAGLGKLLKMTENQKENIDQLTRNAQHTENTREEGDNDGPAPHLPHISLTSPTSARIAENRPSREVPRPNIHPDTPSRHVLSNLMNKSSLSRCRRGQTGRILIGKSSTRRHHPIVLPTSTPALLDI